MEQASTFGVQDQSQNSLLALLSNYVTQVQGLPSVTVPSQNFTSFATGNPFPLPPVDAKAETFGSSEAELPDTNAQHPDSPHNISTSNGKNADVAIRNNISHSNIHKTICEITNNQGVGIPLSDMSQNSLLEAPVSTVPPASITSCDQAFAPAPNGMELVQSTTGAYRGQHWTMERLNNSSGLPETCEASGFMGSRQSCMSNPVNPGGEVLPSCTTTTGNLTGDYGPGHVTENGYQAPMQPHYIQSADPDGQLTQYLQPSHMQDLQHHHMQHDGYSTSAPMDRSGISSEFDKIASYGHTPMYTSSGISAPEGPLQSAVPCHTDAMAYNRQCAGGSESFFPHTPQQTLAIYGGIAAEESAESSRGEKKLTTTPIPSDAEKMSSSGSASGSSNEESPSPREPIQNIPSSCRAAVATSYRNNTGDSHRAYASAGHDRSRMQGHPEIRTRINENSGDVDFGATEVFTCESTLNSSSIPSKDAQTDSFNYNAEKPASGRENVAVHPPNRSDVELSLAVSSGVDTHTTTISEKQIAHLDTTASWCVMKEERRKRKMEKKLQEAKRQLDSTEPTEGRTGEKKNKDGVLARKNPHKHKHKHRSKHHVKSNVSYHQFPANVVAIPQISGNSYSGLIPKVTADPTNNMRLNSGKSSGPPRSITEKVMKERLKAIAQPSQETPKSPTLEKRASATVPPTTKATIFPHIVPAKLKSLTSEANTVSNKLPGRWQTVTAVQEPKMPPMLSEVDRIPKRGRPSKKMSAINLKLKEAEKQQSQSRSVVVYSEPVASKQEKKVSMYTINERGCYETLDKRAKPNQRSIERAEAFRNELLEISKKATIQKKTAGAKDAIGAFKAVGVRTRKQTSSNSTAGCESEDVKRKAKTKSGKVFGGDSSSTASSSTGKVSVMDANTVYTFSELAKQYKISNSILSRVMEQAQRSSLPKKTSKAAHRPKEKPIKPKPDTFSSATPDRNATLPPPSVAIAPASALPVGSNEQVDLPVVKPVTPPIKLTSLSSEKSADLTVAVKKKKKKKKHKKNKSESGGGKKKKKDKKKKSKRGGDIKDFSDPVFNLESNNDVFCTSANVKKSTPETKSQAVSDTNKTNHDLSSQAIASPSLEEEFGDPVRIEYSHSKIGSESSYSAGEEAYGAGGDSSSDVEVASATTAMSLPVATSQITTAVSTVNTSSPFLSTTSSTAVFGSGISAVMPSFQGIKEHGGLQQFAEHTSSLEEASLFRAKKHKHKKKKLTNRIKNASDPEFLTKIEKIIENFKKLKLSPVIGFLAPSFGESSSNVFAKSFPDRRDTLNAFLYRDPVANRLTSKRQGATGFGGAPSDLQSATDTSNISVFCRSNFFKSYGYVKPFTFPNGNDTSKSQFGNNLPLSGQYADSSKQSVFGQNLSASSLQQSKAVSIDSDQSKAQDAKSAVDVDQSKVPVAKSTVNLNQSKTAPRKAGRARGRPKGSSKQASTKVDSSNSASKVDDISKKRGDTKTTSDVIASGKPSSSPALKATTKPVKASSDSTSQSVPRARKKSVNTNDLTSTAPINQDLVNHIKAALSSLASSAVGSDAAVKTVDNAVASFLQNVGTSSDSAQPVPSVLSPATPAKLSRPTGRKRGRPPKLPKRTPEMNQSTDDNTASDKHPKKLWASMHQGATDKLKIKLKHRGPGRPRKYSNPLGKSTSNQPTKSAPSNSQISSNSACQRNTASDFPAPEKKSSSTDRRLVKTAGKKPPSKSHESGKIGAQRKGVKRKIASSDAHYIPSSAGSKHAGADESAVVAPSKRSRKNAGNLVQKVASSEVGKLRLSSEALGKGAAKKSLELVVAKLKSKNKDASSDEEKLSHEQTVADDSFSVDDIEHVGTSGHVTSTDPSRKRKNDQAGSDAPEKRKCDAKDANNHSLLTNGKPIDGDQEETLLPPPIHSGLALREAYKPFQLPHDIWSLYNNDQLVSNQRVDSNYIRVEQNVYFDVSPTSEMTEQACDCSPESAVDDCCGRECRNRARLVECSKEKCPLGERCTNNAIQNGKSWGHLEKYRTPNLGWGIRSAQDVPEKTFLIEYVGEVVSEAEFERRVFENYSSHKHRYCLQLEPGKVLDAYRIGNDARFFNHSCQANCEIQTWFAEGQFRLCIFSNRPIRAGEEMTCDYALHTCAAFAQQQECLCDSTNCCGVIGSPTQRPVETVSNRSNKKDLPSASKKRKVSQEPDDGGRLLYTTVHEKHMQPTSHEERKLIKARKPFLLRNLMRIKRQHEKTNDQTNDSSTSNTSKPGSSASQDRQILLYDAIKEIFDKIMTCKDESGVSVAIPFINLRTKPESTDHHHKDPFDLGFVEDKIETRQYEKFDEFSADLLHAFRNAEKHFGRKSSLGKDVARLRRVYASARSAALQVLGENREKSKSKESKQDEAESEDRRRNGDFIRCICGIYKDEGVMIQCEKCYVWQHCDCMRVNVNDYVDGTEYFCEECDCREVPREVQVVPQPPNAPPGHTYYLTLLKDDILVKQGDCVRIIHDHCLRQRHTNNPPVRSSYRLQSHSAPDRMDFFRIKKLWTDDNGDKFAYGHHFVRPQDTKHQDSRLFFDNELIATPFHEIVPLDAVVGLCCVMDLETYRRGRPKDFKESDIYICQHRTDLTLRIVNKVIKKRYPICTKPHVFDLYPVRLVTVRNVQVPEQYRKSQNRRTQWLRTIDHDTKSDDDDSSDEEEESASDQSTASAVSMETASTDEAEVTCDEKRNLKERRLNGILKKLLKDASKSTKAK